MEGEHSTPRCSGTRCYPILQGGRKAPLSCTGLGTRSPCGPSLMPCSPEAAPACEPCEPAPITRRASGARQADVRESRLGAARWGLLTWDPGCTPPSPPPWRLLGILPRAPPGGRARAPCPHCSPRGRGLGPAPGPACDERAGEAGRTRRKLPRPNIISQMQALWLLGASGDAALMAVLGLLRACGCPA